MTAEIHATALVDPAARIDDTVSIGPYCVVSGGVTLHAGARLDSHVRILSGVEIGANVRIGAHCVLGGAPQISNYEDIDAKLVVGADCVIREHATIHKGSSRGEGVTRLGERCFIMDSAHVAHDCVLEDGATMARGATLGGHALIGAGAYIGGLAAIHQSTRVGRSAFVGGLAPVTRDIPPFCLANGSPARLEGLNLRGLRRSGMPRDTIRALRAAFEAVFLHDAPPMAERLRRAATAFADTPEAVELIEFVAAPSKRGACLAAPDEIRS